MWGGKEIFEKFFNTLKDKCHEIFLSSKKHFKEQAPGDPAAFQKGIFVKIKGGRLEYTKIAIFNF